jgi:hypothetical protein
VELQAEPLAVPRVEHPEERRAERLAELLEACPRAADLVELLEEEAPVAQEEDLPVEE